jgi:catechol 2,3-dioxygenase-like lactoylglutathione lyase family enzyme
MQYLSAVTIVVPDYDEAIAFYVGKLGFTLSDDTPLPDGKRWVTVTPPGSRETKLLLAKAATSEQREAIGRQTGGRVFLFLTTNDFDRDHGLMYAAGVTFVEGPRNETYGKVAVFRDPFGNLWDLIEPARQ